MVLEEALTQLILGIGDFLRLVQRGLFAEGFAGARRIELDGEFADEGGGGRDGADNAVPWWFGLEAPGLEHARRDLVHTEWSEVAAGSHGCGRMRGGVGAGGRVAAGRGGVVGGREKF